MCRFSKFFKLLNHNFPHYIISIINMKMAKKHLQYRNKEVIALSFNNKRHFNIIFENYFWKALKGKGLFERYCAPLLHLAGIKVAIVRTEHEGQARDLMQVMEKTQAVIVAGGDGTLSEVMTGLLRRDDSSRAIKKFPLGLLPLGESNTAAGAVWNFTGYPKPLHLAQATMAIIHNITRPLDLIEITPLQEDTDEGSPAPKPVYAASGLEWGAYRDAEMRRDIYWYWAMAKKYMTFVFSSYKDISWDCNAEVTYRNPCSGCQNCRPPPPTPEAPPPPPPQKWWVSLIPKTHTIATKPLEEEDKVVDYTGIINDECQVEHSTSFGNICDVSVLSCNTSRTTDLPGHSLALRTGIAAFLPEFLKGRALKNHRNKKKSLHKLMLLTLIFIFNPSSLVTVTGKEREFNIDRESYEVRPMTLRPLPKAVTIFAPTPPP
ncbi:unnamed protein product, partial [Meganyctiphanes norvegica]